ncbi:hypothetical protein Btru_067014 [Bulinus truncatus]|nr:hypothetical protein Btru_067014 [Bulinus truncatus]
MHLVIHTSRILSDGCRVCCNFNAMSNYLYLSHCRNVNDVCAQSLLELQHLEVLDLCATEISDKGIALITGYIQKNDRLIPDESQPLLSKLCGLNIDLCCYVTCKSLECLGRLPSLNTLITSSLEAVCTTDIQYLTSMKSLLCLCSKGNMTNDALKHFSEKGCKLQSLLMPVCSVDDTGVKHFTKGFDHLIFLSLNSKSITDDGVKVICHCLPQLILLDLTGCCEITDQPLKCIGDTLLNLVFLSIVLCVRITSRGLSYIPSYCYVRSNISDEELVSFTNKKMHNISDAYKWHKIVKQLSFFQLMFSNNINSS